MQNSNAHVIEKTVKIGGISILIRASHEEFWHQVNRRYYRFYVSDEEVPEEVIEVHVRSDTANTAEQRRQTNVSFSEEGQCVKMQRGTARAVWDRRLHHCKLIQSEADYMSGLHPDYACDSFVRVMLSLKLLEHDGLLVHAAGISKDERGYLFVGQSGAGKSTIARNSALTHTILSDDLVGLARAKDAACIYGTPFYGEHAVAGANVGVPLKGIYFLKKASTNRAEPISQRGALGSFLRSTMYFGEERFYTQTILDIAMTVCERTPCFELHFTADDTFWSVIDV